MKHELTPILSIIVAILVLLFLFEVFSYIKRTEDNKTALEIFFDDEDRVIEVLK